MHEMTAETATKLFLAQEEALEHAAAKIYQLLAQDAELTPTECFSPAARLIGTPRKRTISAREVSHG